MLFKSFVKAAIVASAIAQPVQHHHHQHEKKAVVTHTVVVTVDAGNGETTTSSSAVVEDAAAAATTEAAATEAATTSAEAETATSSTSDSTSTSSGSFDGPAKGITYSPYNADGTCKSASDVATDLEKLTSYEIIRIYGVDCNQAENVLAAMTSDQKLFAGIYYMDAISAGVETLASAVKSNGGWDRVYTVSIGNELVNGGEATVSQVKSYVEEGRTALTSAGYTGDVVSVDTFIAVIDNTDLCEYSDYIAVNAHAYFDGGVTAAEAGEWVLEQIERVYTACGSSKSVFITETGWPTQGDTYGKAVPSEANQKAALDAISESCGNDVTFFNAYNDLWKASGSYNVEKYWGIYD